MKTLKIIKYVFSIFGVGMIIFAFHNYFNTAEFLKTAIISQGTVVELLESRSDNSITYKPVVNFIDNKGVKFEFASSNSSSPPSYDVGEKLEVLYDPITPQNAIIKDFSSTWMGTIIIGIMGIIFLLIGGSFIVYDIKKKNLEAFLKQNGTRIEAEFQSVILNTSLAVNGVNPFQIVSQWHNEATSKLYVFKSDNIWFDPTDFIKSDKIKVIIDRKDPKKYFVDLSFLPEMES